MTQDIERRVELATLVASLTAEVAAIHRENNKRDRIMDELSNDIKELLALANQSRGGFWVGMGAASMLGSIVTWFITNVLLRK